MKNMVLNVLLLSASAGFFAGCGPEAPSAVLPEARPVRLTKALAQPPEIIYSASGVLRAAQRAELSFDRSDVLIDFPVSPGQQVEKGAMLAKIDMRNLDILKTSAQARYDEAEVQYLRIERLYRKEAVAQADLDRARAAFETARADLLQVKKDIEQSMLLAPFSGMVAATLTDRYQTVQARQPVLVLHDISSFDIRISLPETFILNIGKTTNVQARVVFGHLPGQEFPARIKEFSTEADPYTLTYAAVLRMEAPQGENLLPGMSASVQLKVRQENDREGVWVPQAAVFSNDGQQSLVWSVDAQMQAHLQKVETGSLRGGQIEILKGLVAGETVVLSGVHSLQEGAPIKPYDF